MDASWEWLGTPAACAQLGITLRTLYRLIDEGEIAAYRIGRVLRVKQQDIDGYLERSLVKPGTLRHLYPQVDRDLEHYDDLGGDDADPGDL